MRTLLLSILLFCGLGSFAHGQSNDPTNSVTETILYTFGSNTNDGTQPSSLVISPDGKTLYGVTSDGGTLPYPSGTLFSIDIGNKTETILQSFGLKATNTGTGPSLLSISGDGSLFFNTSAGFFSFNTSSELATKLNSRIYSFPDIQNAPNIIYGVSAYSSTNYSSGPFYELLSFNKKTEQLAVASANWRSIWDLGNLRYGFLMNLPAAISLDGTTFYGTAKGNIYSINISSGSQKDLYDFGISRTDGRSPNSVVMLSNDGKTLYGTTTFGGTYGRGAVYMLDINTGVESILYNFGSSPSDGLSTSFGTFDSISPLEGLISISADGKTLYGITTAGGTNSKGTIYAVDTSTGEETILYNNYPQSWIRSKDGKTLYGTIYRGGSNNRGSVFSLDLDSGDSAVLYNIESNSFDSFPRGGALILSPDGGNLYGVQRSPSAYSIFQITLPQTSLNFNPQGSMVFSWGSTFALSATANSAGPITFTSDNPNVISISGNTATVVGAGMTYITAYVAAAGIYPSAYSIASVTVSPIVPTISFIQPTSPVAYTNGGTFTLHATSSSAGTINFSSDNPSAISISGNTATIVGVGTANITASVDPTGNYDTASVTDSVTVNAGVPAVSLTQPTSPITYAVGKTFPLSTTSTSGGSITYTSDNPRVLTISGTIAKIVGVGTANITAAVAATGNYASASATNRVVVSPIVTMVTFTQPKSPITYRAGGTFALSTTSSSGGAVTYTSSDPSVISISGTTATIKGIGSATITASVATKGNYGSANSSKGITVSTASPTVTFTHPKSPIKYTVGSSFALFTTSSSGGSVTYTSSNAGVISVFGNIATVVGVGKATITANIAAKGNYAAGTTTCSVTVTR